ncbi:hypothetical protein DFH07DRAFT_559854 [Mycena maculata]|uniref:Uncharacterized protein n=1 Tax=Mycena maculata TaxID=230809 RepID=A0AAD7N7M5_9AGAR|nr:hypothetical protein DFH07DRAFT_559854 [Mycena maculata]
MKRVDVVDGFASGNQMGFFMLDDHMYILAHYCAISPAWRGLFLPFVTVQHHRFWLHISLRWYRSRSGLLHLYLLISLLWVLCIFFDWTLLHIDSFSFISV